MSRHRLILRETGWLAESAAPAAHELRRIPPRAKQSCKRSRRGRPGASAAPSVDRWVIDSAFRWLVSEADERRRLTMCSINLSGQSLGDDKFLPYVIEQFHRSGIDGSKICVEITEMAAIANFSRASRFIQALKELGWRRFAPRPGRDIKASVASRLRSRRSRPPRYVRRRPNSLLSVLSALQQLSFDARQGRIAVA